MLFIFFSNQHQHAFIPRITNKIVLLILYDTSSAALTDVKVVSPEVLVSFICRVNALCWGADVGFLLFFGHNTVEGSSLLFCVQLMSRPRQRCWWSAPVLMWHPFTIALWLNIVMGTQKTLPQCSLLPCATDHWERKMSKLLAHVKKE